MKRTTISDPQTSGKPNYLIVAGIIAATVLVLAIPPRAPASALPQERARAFLSSAGYQDIELSTPSVHSARCNGDAPLADFTAQGLEMRVTGSVCNTPKHEPFTIFVAGASTP